MIIAGPQEKEGILTMKKAMLLLFSVAVCIYADMVGTAANGRKVILKDDGTWFFDSITSVETAKSTESDGFRDFTWGMSQAKVKAIEKSKFIPDVSTDKILGYQTSVAGLGALVTYVFVNDKLYKGKYVFVEEHSNRNDYISDYESIKKILVKKYGEPKESNTIWKNVLYRDDYQDWGMALSIGHLVFYSEWETATTDISLTMHGDNYKISFEAEYLSKNSGK